MSNYFSLAKPIWSKEHLNEMNINLYFSLDFKKEECKKMVITANNFYRIYLNGKFIAYGPARAAHGYQRVDSYELSNLADENRLVVEVSGSNCVTFYALNTTPFIQAELLDGDGCVRYYTGRDFKCYRNASRLQKVVRFSYQRAFSESYRLNQMQFDFLKRNNGAYKEIETVSVEESKHLDRVVPHCSFPEVTFDLFESGSVSINESNKVYEDRYMFLEGLKIFPQDQWVVNPNRDVSLMDFCKGRETKEELGNYEFSTYAYGESSSGFITLNVDVLEESRIYVIFDEINTSKEKDRCEISFYRNTTHNIIDYALSPGKYALISFEPYTAKYIRVIVTTGKAVVENVGMILYENPEKLNFEYGFANKKISDIVHSAVNTFAQNAVDLLSDCPSRERAGWLCDSFFTSKAEQYITGENKVERAFLENYVLCKKDDIPAGMIPMCYPADFFDGNFIPNWTLWYILELADYYLRTGDYDLVRQSKSNVLGIMDYFSRFENEDGLLEDLEGWVFVEWSKANDADHICGVNYPSNMLYSKALKIVGELYGMKDYTAKSEAVKKVILKQGFNGAFFVDNAIRKENELVLTSNITETAQYYAFYFDIATKESHPKLFDTLISDFGPYRDYKNVYPEIEKSNVMVGDVFRLSILNDNDKNHIALKETIAYFHNMTVLTGTLWEHDSFHASLNHGFTSFIVNVIISSIFGLKHIDNVHKVVVFDSHYLDEDAYVSIPVFGEKLELRISNNERKISLPKGYEMIIK